METSVSSLERLYMELLKHKSIKKIVVAIIITILASQVLSASLFPSPVTATATATDDDVVVSDSTFSQEQNAQTPPSSSEGIERNQEGERQITMNSTSSGLDTSQAYELADNRGPAWSPDGTKIAFSGANISRSPSDIYVINAADGSGLTQLTNGGTSDDSSPTWSPDGTKIAFETRSYTAGTFGSDGIYVINAADGSGETKLIENAYSPTWSPDGTMIAFGRSPDDLYIMNADGSGVTELISGPSSDLNPTWSPDGTMIAFSRGYPSDIYVINAADGSGETRLTNTDDISEENPTWSPDGTMIAFSAMDVSENTFFQDIYIINAADGSGLTQLISDVYNINPSPTWSPDGTKMAFRASDPSGGYTDIYVINAPYTGGATNGGGGFGGGETPLGGVPTMPETPPSDLHTNTYHSYAL
jgi:TolB protein